MSGRRGTRNRARKHAAFEVDGDMTAITFRIPRNLKDSAAEVARRKGMSFSAFVRMSMIDELAKERKAQ